MHWSAVKARKEAEKKTTVAVAKAHISRTTACRAADDHRYAGLGEQGDLHHGLFERAGTFSMQLHDSKAPGLSFSEKVQGGYFVIFPKTSVCLPIWDSIIASLIVFCAWAVPYEVGFMLLLRDKLVKEESRGMLGLRRTTMTIDMLFFFDMLLQLIVSYPHPTNRRWIRRPTHIIWAYFKGHFVIDFLSVLPYDKLTVLLEKNWGDVWRFSGLLSLLMLLRMLRVGRMIERYESRIDIDYSWVNMISLMITLFLTVHWGACFWGFILGSEWFFELENGHTWYDAIASAKPVFFKQGHFEDPTADGGWALYTASLYWSAMTVTSIGYGDVTAMNRIEAAATTAFMLIGGVIWAHIIGNVCAIASSFSAGKAAYESQMDSLNEMMRSLHLNQDLKIELREYFMRRRLLYHREKQVELLRSMSPMLQEKVARSVQERVLKVWFFRDIKDSGFLVGLFERFLYQVYPPRELIKLSHSLCNLREGMALRGYRIQFPGDIWGEAELLLSNVSLLEDVLPVPLSFLEIQYLTRENLDQLTLHYPDIRRIIQKAGAWMALRRAVIVKYVKPSWDKQSVQDSRSGSPSGLRSTLPGERCPVSNMRRRTSSFDGEMFLIQQEGDPTGESSSVKRYAIPSGTTSEFKDMKNRIARIEGTQEDVASRVCRCESRLNEALTILRGFKERSTKNFKL